MDSFCRKQCCYYRPSKTCLFSELKTIVQLKETQWWKKNFLKSKSKDYSKSWFRRWQNKIDAPGTRHRGFKDHC